MHMHEDTSVRKRKERDDYEKVLGASEWLKDKKRVLGGVRNQLGNM